LFSHAAKSRQPINLRDRFISYFKVFTSQVQSKAKAQPKTQNKSWDSLIKREIIEICTRRNFFLYGRFSSGQKSNWLSKNNPLNYILFKILYYCCWVFQYIPYLLFSKTRLRGHISCEKKVDNSPIICQRRWQISYSQIGFLNVMRYFINQNRIYAWLKMLNDKYF